LNKKIATYKQFVWNTYLLESNVDKTELVPGDDCESFVWLSLDDIRNNKRVSEALQTTFIQHFSK